MCNCCARPGSVCLFPDGIAALKRTQQWPLAKPGTRQLLRAVVDAARRSGVPLLEEDAPV